MRRDVALDEVDARLTLPDGRQMAYRIYGVTNGTPIYFFHGFPGSRLQAALIQDQARASALTLVAFDRPGFGRSDPSRRSSLESIAGDVLRLSEALGHRRFAVLGVSCGGPHALATAWRMPDRVNAVGLLAGIGPMDRPVLRVGQLPLLRAMFRLAGWWPGLISPLLALDWMLLRSSPEMAIRALSAMMTAPDRRLLEASAQLRQAFAASLAEAYRQGIGGAMQEAARIAHFGEALLDGVVAPVYLHQSGQDAHVPPAMGRYMARRLRNCHYHEYPGEGHLSIVVNRFEACARQLAGSL